MTNTEHVTSDDVRQLLELAEHVNGIALIDGYARSEGEYLAATRPEKLVPILKHCVPHTRGDEPESLPGVMAPPCQKHYVTLWSQCDCIR